MFITHGMVLPRCYRVGVVGTGYVARHFSLACQSAPDLRISRVLTRRPMDTCGEFPLTECLTNSLAELIDTADVVFECTGDPRHAAEVVDACFRAKRPVVTMNAEFHVTAGSYFVGKGLLSEAEGDQPGSQAALHEQAVALGFQPIVYGNMKGFLDHTPTRDAMRQWARRNGISVPMVTAFTDGTKLQIEQALVANGLGATIAEPGLLGPAVDSLRMAAHILSQEAHCRGRAIADYVLSPQLPHGVFVIAQHDERERDCLRYLKLGPGPDYVLQNPHILLHLEVPKTIRRVLAEGTPLLDNGRRPTVSVMTVAKQDLQPGTRIAQGIGSFEVRGIAVMIADYPGHAPIGLVADAIVRRPIKAGDPVALDDIEIPESLALRAWRHTEKQVLRDHVAIALRRRPAARAGAVRAVR